ncbi:MAG: FtsX-like permease family protein [Spirochaetia bacterium]
MKRIGRFFMTRIRSARVVSKIAFRNLIRQFRRNVLLSAGIAIGMCILVVTSSFTNGLTDILFNKMLVYMSGHIKVVMDEYTTRRSDVIRDTDRFIKAIKANVDGIKEIDQAVSAFGRAVGNGKTGLVALVGVARDSNFYQDTDLESGNVRDIYKPDIFPGILLYKNAATELNVGLNDIVTVRFQTVYGQSQAPKYKVVGLIPSSNMYMDVAAFVDRKTLRQQLNMKPNESLGLQVVTAYPQDAQKVIEQANKLQKALAPGAAGVKAVLRAQGRQANADVFALRLETGPDALALVRNNLQFVKGDIRGLLKDKTGIILTQPLAQSLGADVGTRIDYRYVPLNAPDPVETQFVVTGIVKTVSPFAEATAFAHEDSFYKTYFWNIPRDPARVAEDAPLFKALLPEWEMLARSKNTDEATKKIRLLNREAWKGARVDVQTMFENASAVVDLQKGLNTISIVAVLILFFVILIGVVNTMRMSIRERTREIGTNRAIGMQRSDVRSVFVMEIVFLAVFACIAGIGLSYGLMALLGVPTFDLKDNPFSMFFVNKHIYFVPTVGAIIGNFFIIVIVSFLIAFFTARRAAKLRVADALRHFE